ncbi:MAG: membrane protein insertion efficiency factor YidD [Candidatus Omnitrophica bacterium]|nr:membrane protein insertion efficiency factor YidD [Candidatus Omnitrophota bacterium]
MKKILIQLIHLYKWISASGIFPPACRFYPTCSSFMEEALHRHPLAKAVGLATGRLLRCHPWHPGGIDPVP